MSYHKLLSKQLSKHLPASLQQDPALEPLLKAVSESYMAYDRDKDLSERAFRLTEEEYADINEQLKEEIEVRERSVVKLREALGIISGEEAQDDTDDLLVIARYLNQQIREKKNAEKVFTSLITNIQSGILLEDETRHIVYTNQLFCNMFQIPVECDKLTGLDCSNSAEESKLLFTNPEHFVKRIDEILRDRKLVKGEVLLLKDGKVFLRDYIPIYLDNEYRGHLWNYTDITESRKAQDEVAQSEWRNRLIMNSALDAIVTMDVQGLITFWNPQAEKIFGWKEEEVIGKSLADTIIPESFRSAHHRGLAHYLATGEHRVLNRQLEISANHRNGGEFPIELSIVPILHGETLFFCSFIRDISARKQNEEKLRVNEEKYRNIITNMNLGLLEVDTEENIQFVNNSFCEMSGYAPDELVGRKAADLFLRSENAELMESKNELRKKGVMDAYEIAVKNKRGELKWWLISGAPRYDDKGQLIGSIGIHLDITQQKALEHELIEARELAEQSARSQEMFLANMSHEIRTPLNAIMGMSRELAKTDLTAKQLSFLEAVNSAGEQLLVVINDILDISKIQAGKLHIESIPFRLAEIGERVKQVMSHRAEEKGISLNWSIDAGVHPVLIGDPYRLNQVLLNLVSNAIKFTERGNVRVHCQVENENTTRQTISFTVQDTGIGMEKEFTQRIFENFSQEDRTVARKFGGTGLGMSISKQLVGLMNGEIEVESEKGVGTKVYFHLPFRKGAETDISVKDQAPIDSGVLNGKRILLAEDNEMNRLVATTVLEHYGAQIIEVINGQEALEAIRKDSYDLVLMDVQMPVMDGLEATRRIRRDLQSTVPILALTANAIKGENEICFAAGMNDYLTKPFKEEDLVGLMSKWLGRDPGKRSNQSNMESAHALFDLSKLQEISKGNKAFVEKMVQLFSTQAPLSVKEIKEAYAFQDLEKVKAVAHRLKPSIDNMGIQSLTREIRQIEALALSGDDGNELPGLIGQLETTLTKVVDQLQKV